MTGCRTECHSLAHNEPAVQEVKVYRHHCQQPLQFYRELRAQACAPFVYSTAQSGRCQCMGKFPLRHFPHLGAGRYWPHNDYVI